MICQRCGYDDEGTVDFAHACTALNLCDISVQKRLAAQWGYGPSTVTELLGRLEAAESDALEQARLNGMGGEREAALMAKLEVAESALSNLGVTPEEAKQGLARFRAREQEVKRLTAELAASQAREKAMLAALGNIRIRVCGEAMPSWEDTPRTSASRAWIADIAEWALALPTDDTALRAALVKAQEEMRERAAAVCEEVMTGGIAAYAAAIIELEAKP